MTPQEQKMLDDLIARVDNTRLDERDPEAAQRIAEWTARNLDAAYILVQTILVQNYALEQAKAQIQSLRENQQHPLLPQQTKPTSFLGSLFGHKDEARPQPPAPAYAQPQQGYAPVPPYAQQAAQPGGYSQPGYGAPQAYPPAAGGGSSFLRSAATTAAGVAAGALAFQGIESLMHGFGHEAGFGGGGLGSGLGDFGGRPEETVINNYYDSPGTEHDGGSAGAANADIQQFAHEGDGNLSTQQDVADNVNVDDGGGQLQADTDLPTLDNDGGSYDDASLGDSSLGDSSLDDGALDDSSFGDDNS